MKRLLKVLSTIIASVVLCLGCFSMAGCGADIRTAKVKVQLYDFYESEFYTESEVTMSIDLYAHLAPTSVAAIEKYINNGYYDNAIFYKYADYEQVMVGDLLLDGDGLIIEEGGAKVNIVKNAIKPKLPGEFTHGGTVGSDLLNKKGSIGLWRGWYENSNNWTTSTDAYKSGTSTLFMPMESLSAYDGFFCVLGQFDLENESNETAFEGIVDVFSDQEYYTRMIIYYTEKDGGYDATKDDYNLEFHCITYDYFNSLSADEKEALNIFEPEGAQIENFERQEIYVPNNASNGKCGAKIKSARMA